MQKEKPVFIVDTLCFTLLPEGEGAQRADEGGENIGFANYIHARLKVN